MEIGLSTLVWVLIILVVIKFWRNIVNLIGGLVWLGVFVLIAIFIITNFTTLNIDKYVDISFYDDLRRGETEYLVEKKDTAFDSALKMKDDINTIGTEDDAFKEQEDVTEVEVSSASSVRSIEESNLNFNDESKGATPEGEPEGELGDKEGETQSETKSETESETKSKETKEGIEGGLIGYDTVDTYLEELGGAMSEDTKNLVRNLSPYVSWKYSDGDWRIESTSEGIILEEL